jgi:hypothetical protein
MTPNITPKASFSIPSIIAIVAAVLTFRYGATLGFVFAGVAILFGIIGMVESLSQKKRGGIISAFGILGGGIGIIAAVIKAIMWLTSKV